MLTRNRQTRARTNTKISHQHQHVGISVNTDNHHTTNNRVLPNKIQKHPAYSSALLIEESRQDPVSLHNYFHCIHVLR